MLVYFYRKDCPACARLNPTWSELAHGHDVMLHQVHLDGLPNEAAVSEGRVTHWSATPLHAIREARIQSVPAVLRVGPDCRISAAGSGLTTSRAVLRQLAAAP